MLSDYMYNCTFIPVPVYKHWLSLICPAPRFGRFYRFVSVSTIYSSIYFCLHTLMLYQLSLKIKVRRVHGFYICTSTCTEYTVQYIFKYTIGPAKWLSILRRQHHKTLLALNSASLKKCVGVANMDRLDQGHLYFLVERRKNKRIDPSCSPNETASAL